MDYIIYVCDCETTNLDNRIGDIIEVSFHRLTDNIQKTWCIKPINTNGIDKDALRINGHKKEDLLHQTKEGQERYLDPVKAMIEIENFVMDDGVPNTQRILAGQNINFDKDFLEQHWIKCDAKDSFPFGRRTLDIMTIQFFMDLCKGELMEGYNLNAIGKKYGLKNEKSHTAAADVKVTKDVLLEQIKIFSKVLKNG